MENEHNLDSIPIKDASQDQSVNGCSVMTSPNYTSRTLSKSGTNKIVSCAYPGCDKTFKKSSHLKTHSYSHKTGNSYVCDWVFCGKPFTTIEELRQHVDIMHTVKGHTFVTRTNQSRSNDFERQVVPNSSQNAFPSCNSSNNNLSSTWIMTDNMSVNLTVNTKREEEVTNQVRLPKRYFCHMSGCEKAFRKSWHLKAHIRSHTGERPFACQWPLCGKRFTRSDKLYRHMNVHTKGKHFSCPVCDKSFMRNDNLTQHLKTHAKPCDSGAGLEDNYNSEDCLTLQ